MDRPEKVGPALERALSRPEELMREIRAYTMHHEPHRDCRCSARVLDAVDDYIARGHAGTEAQAPESDPEVEASPSDALLPAAGDVPPLIACEKQKRQHPRDAAFAVCICYMCSPLMTSLTHSREFIMQLSRAIHRAFVS